MNKLSTIPTKKRKKKKRKNNNKKKNQPNTKVKDPNLIKYLGEGAWSKLWLNKSYQVF